MKAFTVCYDENGFSKLLIHHKEQDIWAFEDGQYYSYYANHFPAVAAISGEFYDCQICPEEKYILVWVKLVPETLRTILKLPMKDKQLMNEFYTHFKKQLGMNRSQFDLLLNL